MSGIASVPASWWHESYIDPEGLYRVYRGIANFVADEKDLANYAWKPLKPFSVSYIQPPSQLTYMEMRFTGNGPNWQKPEKTIFTVKKDGTVENANQLLGLLHGYVHEELRIPLTFRVDFPTQGEFIIHVGKVGDDGILSIFLDDKKVSSVELPTGEGLGVSSEYNQRWERWETVYDKDISVTVPAGEHEIRIQNDGMDWITIRSFRLTNYRSNAEPNLRVLGMQTSKKALVWVQNNEHTWYNVRDKAPVPPVDPTKLILNGFDYGNYNVEIWNTVEGNIIEKRELRSETGELIVDLPKIKKDIALKIKPFTSKL
jgi:hypothetical protein